VGGEKRPAKQDSRLVRRRGGALLVSIYDLAVVVRLIRIAITAAAYEAIATTLPLRQRRLRGQTTQTARFSPGWKGAPSTG
jgi:hypothetical protein